MLVSAAATSSFYLHLYWLQWILRLVYYFPVHFILLFFFIFMDFSSLFIYCYMYIPFIDCTSFSVPMSRCFSYRHTELNSTTTTTKNRIFLSFEITEHQIPTSKRKFKPYMWVCYTDKHLLIGLWLIFEYEQPNFSLSTEEQWQWQQKNVVILRFLFYISIITCSKKCHSFSAFKKRMKKPKIVPFNFNLTNWCFRFIVMKLSSFALCFFPFTLQKKQTFNFIIFM